MGAATAMSQPQLPLATGRLKPCRFLLDRRIDISGISGTGVVAEGVLWSDGTAALRWYGTWPTVTIWNSVQDLVAVHGHQHSTVLCWLDDEPSAGPSSQPTWQEPAVDRTRLERTAASISLQPPGSGHRAAPDH